MIKVKNYEIIKQTSENDYEAKDIYTKEIVQITRYKSIDISNWDMGSKVNNELRKLRLNNELKDYFYIDDKDNQKKNFYKVFSDEIKEEKHQNTSNKKHRKNIILKPICEACKSPISLRSVNPIKNKAFCGKCHRERGIIMAEPEITVKENLSKPQNLNLKITNKKFVAKLTSHKFTAFILFLSLLGITYLKHHYIGELNIIDLYIIIPLLLGITLLLFNGKYIEISEGILTVSSKPLRVKKARIIPINDLYQLYVKKAGRSEFDYEQKTSAKNMYFSTYYLKAILNDNSHLVLYKCKSPKTASFLEYQIEEYLHIQDKYVENEYDINTDATFED